MHIGYQVCAYIPVHSSSFSLLYVFPLRKRVAGPQTKLALAILLTLWMDYVPRGISYYIQQNLELHKLKLLYQV